MRTTFAALALSSLVGLLPACGKTRLPGGDGDGVDAAPDATSIGPVSVTVLSFDGLREPLAGERVGFFDPDGAHQVTVETGPDGIAVSDLEAGGSVVVFLTGLAAGTAAPRAYAVLAVEPGDEIVVGGEPSLTSAPASSMDIVLPPVTGATNYELYTSCGNSSSGTSTVSIDIREQCDADTISFLAITAGSDAVRQYLREEDVPVVASYNAMASWQMTPTRPFLFTNVPGEVNTIDVRVSAVRAGDDLMEAFLLSDAATVANDMITLRPERIPSYDGTLVTTLARAEQPALGSFQLARWLGPDDPTDADLGAAMLPWMGPIIWDTTTRTLSWRLVGEDDYDATYVTFVASFTDGEIFRETIWQVAGPPGIEEIVLPELPSDLSSWFIADPEDISAFGSIVESDQLDGWDAARQRGLDLSYFPKAEPIGSVTRATFSGTTVR
jgi:hypothetical protein